MFSSLELGLLILTAVLFVILIYIAREYVRLKTEFNRKIAEEANALAKQMLKEWKREHEEELRRALEREYTLKMEEALRRREREIRKDAIKRSVATLLGRISEYIAPLLVADELGANPKDFRFIGTPVDYIVFKGLSEDDPKEIIFVEVKASKTLQLTKRERAVKRLVEEKRVSWRLVSMRQLMEKAYAELERKVKKAVDQQLS